MSYVTWYAQFSGSWGDNGMWLDASSNPGIPDDLDYAESNGFDVGLGNGNLPDHITLLTNNGGSFTANTSRSIGTGNSACWMQGNLHIAAPVRFEAYCLALYMTISLDSGGNLSMLGGFYQTTLNRNGGTFTIYPDLTMTGSSGAMTVAGQTVGTGGTVPDAGDVRDGVAVGVTNGTLKVPDADDVRYGADVDATTGTLKVPAAGDVRDGTDVDATKGTLKVPAAGDVEEGVDVDATTGTFKVPPVSKVEDNYGYGAGGTEFTGELPASGGADASEVAAAVWNFNMNGQAAQAVLESLPTAAGVWAYTTRTITAGGATPQQIWEYATRTLSAGDAVAFAVWNYNMNWQTAQTRLESLTTEAIWQYSDRTLTSGNGPGLDDIADAVKAAVWNYAFTGGEAAGTTGHTLHMTGDITAIAVWEYTTRSLSSPPPSAAAIRQEIDGNSTQFASIDARLTSLEETVAVIPTDTTSAVWGAETRTLSSYGTLVADTAAASATSVWAAATRSLTDKSGFAPTAVAIRQEIDANSTTIATIDGVVDGIASALTSLATDVPSAEEIRQEIDANSSMLSTIDLKVDSTQGSLDSLDARIPAALQGGRMQSYVGAMAGGVVSASTLATGTITTAKFAAGAIDAAAVGSDTLTAIAAALLSLANGIETGVTLKQALQRIGAVVAGKSSGAGTGVESFTGLDGSTPRVTINVASDGNRAGATYS